jgi:AraC-like DNA-binding protein
MAVSESAARQLLASGDHPESSHFLKMRDRITYMQATRFINVIELTYQYIFGERFDVRDLTIRSVATVAGNSDPPNSSPPRRLQTSSQDTSRFEKELLGLIRKGDVEGVARQAIAPTGNIGIVTQDPLRQEKDMFIIITALASRAAIDGGLSPSEALTSSNSYIARCEKATTILSVKELYRTMVLGYTAQVARRRYDKPLSATMRRAVDYIYGNLAKPMNTADIARHLGYSRSHFSKVFARELSLSPKDFLRRARVEKAKELLMDTDYSVAEIATYVGAGSPSRFIVTFRELTGMTPNHYRKSISVT